MKKTIGALMVAVSAVAMAANANAMEYNPYVGVEYGYSFVNGGVDANNFNSGKVFVGSQYNQNFGVEAFYQRTTSDKKAVKDGPGAYKVKYEAYGIDALGYLPMGCDQDVSLIGTVGLAYYDVKSKNEGGKADYEGMWGYRMGAGAEYNVTENVAVRALARYTKLDQRLDSANDMMEYSLGARYNF